MTAFSDRELLLRYTRHADQRAFTDLVQRHINLVYASALRHLHGDRHRAEDVTQEVFALLARKASGLSEHSSLPGWLYATARLSALDTLRREQRRLHRETKAEAMSLSDHSPQPLWETVRPVLDDALQDLDERERLPVILRFFGQQSFNAIGQQLGVSENAAQKRVERALDLLNSALGKRGIASTAAFLGASLSHAAITAPTALATAVSTAALASVAAAPAAAGFLGLGALATKTLAAGAVAVVVATGAVFAWQASATAPAESPANIVAHASAPTPTATLLPPNATPQASAPISAPAKSEPARLPAQILYMVQRGDSVAKIARLWNVTPERLVAANSVYDFSLMRVGDQVVIPPEGYVTDSAQLQSNVYVIVAGDSLPKIAAKTGVSTEQLRAANPTLNWARLRVGQSVKLQ